MCVCKAQPTKRQAAELCPQLLLDLPPLALDVVCQELIGKGGARQLKPLYCTCKAMRYSPVLGALLTKLEWPGTHVPPCHDPRHWQPEWTAELRQQLLHWPACVPSLETLHLNGCSPGAMAALTQLATEGLPRVLQLLAGITKLEFSLQVSVNVQL